MTDMSSRSRQLVQDSSSIIEEHSPSVRRDKRVWKMEGRRESRPE